ncbi:hypothetical protein M8J76_003910 [Diaphorina citri]|nr:hypothetical protein M8J75_002878 [Diaphorina citri]KAI5719020.1 hypothetical protein M8J76_003910 [Diaphorina citri]
MPTNLFSHYANQTCPVCLHVTFASKSTDTKLDYIVTKETSVDKSLDINALIARTKLNRKKVSFVGHLYKIVASHVMSVVKSTNTKEDFIVIRNTNVDKSLDINVLIVSIELSTRPI